MRNRSMMNREPARRRAKVLGRGKLMTLVIATTACPGMADDPRVSDQKNASREADRSVVQAAETLMLDMPPLPITPAAGVETNPFCEEDQPTCAPVRLASGDRGPAVGLRPIGDVVGLVPINRAQSTGPAAKLSIADPKPDAIRRNPLFDSQQDDGIELNERAAADGCKTAKPVSFSFSLSDRSAADDEGSAAVEMTLGQQNSRDEPLEESEADAVVSESIPILVEVAPPILHTRPFHGGHPEQADDLNLPWQFDPAETESVSVGSGATEHADWESASSGVPTPPSDEQLAGQRSDSADPSESIEDKALRYRPAVAVAAPPINYRRTGAEASAEIVRPAAEPITVPLPPENPGPTSLATMQSEIDHAVQLAAAESGPLTPLHMSLAQVRSLSIQGRLERVRVANPSICQAVTTASNQIKLIGTGSGTTQLVIWAVVDGHAETQRQAFAISVHDGIADERESGGDATQTLNRSIAQAFPTARVQVTGTKHELLVAGSCESEEAAEQIVRMVRKTCLVPVRDELIVR